MGTSDVTVDGTGDFESASGEGVVLWLVLVRGGACLEDRGLTTMLR